MEIKLENYDKGSLYSLIRKSLKELEYSDDTHVHEGKYELYNDGDNVIIKDTVNFEEASISLYDMQLKSIDEIRDEIIFQLDMYTEPDPDQDIYDEYDYEKETDFEEDYNYNESLTEAKENETYNEIITKLSRMSLHQKVTVEISDESEDVIDVTFSHNKFGTITLALDCLKSTKSVVIYQNPNEDYMEISLYLDYIDWINDVHTDLKRIWSKFEDLI